MRLPRFRSIFSSRRLLRALEGVDEGLREQNVLLKRLADQFAPEQPAEVATDTGVSHLRGEDLMVALDYVERFRADIGRDPTDDETVSYLADLKTKELTEKLSDRERLLNELPQR